MDRTQTRRRLAPFAIWPLTALAIGIAHDGTTRRTGPPHPARTALPGGEAGLSLQAAYGRLPLHFERNVGQTDGRAQYLARGAGYALFLAADEAVLALRQEPPAVVRARLVGARPDPEVVGEEPLLGRSHYFLGNDSAKWRTDVPQVRRVTYRGLWPGIDLTYYGNQRQLEYDFVVAPGADPGVISLAYEGVEALSLDGAGNLVLRTAHGELVQQAPLVYQQSGDERRGVEGRFVLAADRRVGFEVGPFDRSLPLVIDPVLVYSTYVGGNTWDYGQGIAVDGAGSAYVAGRTWSVDFPTQGAIQTFQGGVDAFVTKLSADGSSLVYSTYLGGGAEDIGLGVAVDGGGNAYVTGHTGSDDFPTLGPFQATRGGYDAFVTKLSPDGSSLVYSTYLGGSKSEQGKGIAVDGLGHAYVAGTTYSTDFPTLNPVQTDRGDIDAFVTKLSATGSSLVYSTYLGGSYRDEAWAIAVDDSGNAYVTGEARSPDFPTQGAIQTSRGGADAFVTKLSATGSSLVYSTFLGGSHDDLGTGIAVDGPGNAYVTGYTASADFPTLRPVQADQGGVDVFVTKVTANGSSLVYSTYLGGAQLEYAYGIAVDDAGNAYVVGFTDSPDFPTQAPVQADQGSTDVFVTALSSGGSGFVYSTYLGGNDTDYGFGIAVGSSGDAYVTGAAYSADFPTTLGAFQTTQVGGDAFVAKLHVEPPPPLDFHTLTPCRLLDTRDAAGAFGGPALAAGAARVFPLHNRCGIPPTARALSVNLTVTQPTASGNFRLYPAGIPLPVASSINYAAGQTRANNAIAPLSANGELAIRCSQASGTAHSILDVNGYFQ